ncbi:hypothetical protein ACJX0J_013778, partial [Zea mays]
LIEVRHIGENIVERIAVVVEEYCLIDKIFSNSTSSEVEMMVGVIATVYSHAGIVLGSIGDVVSIWFTAKDEQFSFAFAGGIDINLNSVLIFSEILFPIFIVPLGAKWYGYTYKYNSHEKTYEFVGKDEATAIHFELITVDWDKGSFFVAFLFSGGGNN